MELTNEFSLKVPVDEAWAVLTDLERVAPCMPGFQLLEIEGEEYRGVVRVKVGPVVAQYRGVASFRERDEAGRRAVVRAEGREARGQGSAAATVTATLAPGNGGTQVTLHTDLLITGKVAQFGRGVLADVSRKLLGQFVQALEADVLSGAEAAPKADVQGTAAGEPADGDASQAPRDGAGDESRVEAAAPGVRSTSGEPVDLLATAAPSVIKRVGPMAAALVVVLGLALWLLLRG